MHTPQPLQCTISAEETVGFPAVRPIAAAQEGKCMLNGEVAAVNTQLRNMVGEIHQAAGLWEGGSPGVAHVYHSLLLCPFSLGGGWASCWCYSLGCLSILYIASPLFYYLCNAFPRFNSLYFKYLPF